MTSDEQIAEWVAGRPVHNKDRDECCPDFSCCTPETLAAEATRIRFRDASENERLSMLAMFLGAAIDNHYAKKPNAKSVYIADGTSHEVH